MSLNSVEPVPVVNNFSSPRSTAAWTPAPNSLIVVTTTRGSQAPTLTGHGVFTLIEEYNSQNNIDSYALWCLAIGANPVESILTLGNVIGSRYIIAVQEYTSDIGRAFYTGNKARVDSGTAAGIVEQIEGVDAVQVVMPQPFLSSASWVHIASNSSLTATIDNAVENYRAVEHFTSAQIQSPDANPALQSTSSSTPVSMTAIEIGEEAISLNEPPTANAGVDISGTEGTQFQLDGRLSNDNDGTIAGWKWTQIGAGDQTQLNDDTLPQPEGVYPAGNQTISYALVVVDNDGAFSVEDIVNVSSISATNNAPTAIVANAKDLNNTGGDVVELDASLSTDPENNIVAFEWTGVNYGSGVLAIDNADQAIASITCPVFTINQSNTSGIRFRRYGFDVKVTDAGGLSSIARKEVVVSSYTPGIDLSLLPDELPDVHAGRPILLDGSELVADPNVRKVEWYSVYPNYYPATYNSLILLGNYLNTICEAVAPSENEDLTTYIVANITGDNGNDTCKIMPVRVLHDPAIPTAVAIASVSEAEEGAEVTIDLTQSINLDANSKFRARQCQGPLIDGISSFDGQFTFTVPSFLTARAFAQDVAVEQPVSTPSNIHYPLCLLKDFEIDYLGCFRVDQRQDADQRTASFSKAIIALSVDGARLFMSGHESHGYAAEMIIPETLYTGDDYSQAPVAVHSQPYEYIEGKWTEGDGNIVQNEYRINGMLAFLDANGVDERLLFTSEDRYDAGAARIDNLQYIENANDMANSPFKGYLQLQGAARAAGYISAVPPELQAEIGAPYIAGHTNKYSINTRYSFGLAAFPFDPQDAVTVDILGDRTIGSTELMGFSLTNQVVPNADDTTNFEVGFVWATLTSASFAFFVPGTRIFMGTGVHAGANSGIGYKIIRTVNGAQSAGSATFESGDSSPYMWFHDLDTMLSAEEPYNNHPYAYAKWNLPFPGGKMAGNAYDPVNEILYVATERSASVGQYDSPPLIQAFRFRKRTSANPLVIPPVIEFDIEVDRYGYKDFTKVAVNVNVQDLESIYVSLSGGDQINEEQTSDVEATSTGGTKALRTNNGEAIIQHNLPAERIIEYLDGSITHLVASMDENGTPITEQESSVMVRTGNNKLISTLDGVLVKTQE